MSSIPELKPPALRATRMRLHAQHQPIALMRADCHVCRSEGLSSRSQVLIVSDGHEVQAQLYQIDSDLLADCLRVDERCDVYVAEESGHVAAFSTVARLSLVK